MKRILRSLVVLSLLLSGYAYAATYTYTGVNYTEAYGAYTTAMRITGSFTTSIPIPPNSSFYDVAPIITSWSFSDGLQTITSASGQFRPGSPPHVTTDSQGNITDTFFLFWDSPIATQVGDSVSSIWVKFDDDLAWYDQVCVDFTQGSCLIWTDGDFARNELRGVWEDNYSPPIPPIPTMSQWSLILLTLLLGMVGFARLTQRS